MNLLVLPRLLLAHIRRTSAADALRPILGAWGVRFFIIRNELGGTAANNWLIQNASGLYVLRRMSTGTRYLDYQIAVIRHLEASGYPYDVPTPVRTRTGSDYVDRDGVQWQLYRFVAGEDALPAASHVEVRELATMVALYHRAMANFTAPRHGGQFRTRLFALDSVTETLSTALLGISGSDARPLATALRDHGPALLDTRHLIRAEHIKAVSGLPTTTLYNDWHRHNRIMRNGRLHGLIDFDSVTQGPRIVDFQAGLTHLLAEADTPPDPSRIRAYSGAYESVLSLDAVERELIYPVMIDRLLWLTADIVREFMREGRSSRESLALRLLELTLWLAEDRRRFMTCLERDSGR